jgi:hypothetical protein
MLQSANARADEKRDSENDDRHQVMRPKKPLGRRRFGAVLFVLFTFCLWFVFGTFAEVVITCVPGGARCLVADDWWVWRAEGPTGAINKREAFVMVLSLMIAAWAAMRVFYPPEDFEASEVD